MYFLLGLFNFIHYVSFGSMVVREDDKATQDDYIQGDIAHVNLTRKCL